MTTRRDVLTKVQDIADELEKAVTKARGDVQRLTRGQPAKVSALGEWLVAEAVKLPKNGRGRSDGGEAA